jgi:hypothetical protein
MIRKVRNKVGLFKKIDIRFWAENPERIESEIKNISKKRRKHSPWTIWK